MPVLSHVHDLFNIHACHAYIHTLDGKIARSNVPVARGKTWSLG